MRPVMIFKFGVTVIVLVAIVIFYILHYEQQPNENDSYASKQKILKDKHSHDSDKSEHTLNINKDNESKIKSKDDTNSNVDENQPEKKNIHKKLHMQDDKPKEKMHSKDKKKQSSINQNADHTVKKSKKSGGSELTSLMPVFKSTDNRSASGLHLAVVACGDRRDESLVLLKSAVLFTKKKLIFHIFAEKELQTGFRDQFQFWPDEVKHRIEYFIYDISFPRGSKTDEWKKLFKPCASQRLFIPLLLTDIDSLLYVDTDILFLSPLDEVWEHFSKFNSTQLASLAPEHEDAAAGWYNRFARHPFYGKLGLNSGVMLMNLTRLRASTWLPSLIAYFKEYALKITWGDQDLINIYFYYHPDELYVWPCEWNYRPDHCMYMSVCRNAEATGAYILHGCRRVFLNDKQPAFRAVYNAFRDHWFGADIESSLLSTVKKNLEPVFTSPCGKYPHIFTKQIEKYIKTQKTFTKNGVRENIQLETKDSKFIPVPHPPS
ncbi:glucoside xylosyltransferase 2-like isoform X2 [Gigantopelta aegis]|uniref:glucoside xylosyltransferase 2-like isoform X2 n=1 Tax=Gigantopelta aegis TaxID=1735272 RepID=UPI001B887B4C|nr:glucoside xylosyltransferase 2-like isoform X2 [Gigantopelta aegis]